MQYYILVPQRLLLEISPQINLKQAYLLSGMMGMIAKKNFLRETPHETDVQELEKMEEQEEKSWEEQEVMETPAEKEKKDEQNICRRKVEKEDPQKYANNDPQELLEENQKAAPILSKNLTNCKNKKNIKNTLPTPKRNKYVWVTTSLLQRQLPLLSYQSQRVIARQLRALVKMGLLSKRQWEGDRRTYWGIGKSLLQGLKSTVGGTIWCDKTNKEETEKTKQNKDENLEWLC